MTNQMTAPGYWRDQGMQVREPECCLLPVASRLTAWELCRASSLEKSMQIR